MQIVHCLTLLMHDTDQSKESVGNYIISVETLDELEEVIE